LFGGKKRTASSVIGKALGQKPVFFAVSLRPSKGQGFSCPWGLPKIGCVIPTATANFVKAFAGNKRPFFSVAITIL